MPATKMTSKGQITLPKAVREKLGISPLSPIPNMPKPPSDSSMRPLPKALW